MEKSSEVVLTNKNYLAEAKTRNHFLTIDEPVVSGGDNNGPTPVEYLLSAVGGCVSITLRMYVERKGWDVGKIKVIVSQKEAQTATGIKKWLEEDISFEKEVTEEQRKRLLTIAGKCPVAKMIKGETLIETSIQ
ncbi:osmotically inducible protein OsmC [Polaribacter reichenbachii]|uniref:Osmotically inducible protein OsmC n=1 Tax=Polaribacter reichenbachii TaxID=996801 RepID=A0A1B8U447_9FLAO|nr:OsmC family protein [Polaribacter reichenbachii]APZ47932.1 osmotically inducible protein OsmC [Polaribacter reichenbachii]AUC18564.1 osmotically inducible protein OsmC [Polaribacter reichenbachii]OBY66634.1 osmotically inducible protein OsmC [Polaribacter reichenbachii]